MNNNQDKSFEKKLQSLSADFELKPSTDIWNKIEAQLPVKRKRRFIFIFILLGIAIIVTGVFVSNNDYKISGSGSNSSRNNNTQGNTVGLDDSVKTNYDNISKAAVENKSVSAITATGNSLSPAGISIKNNQSKNHKSHTDNNASNTLTDVKNNEQSITESSMLTNENEIANEELIRMTLFNPALTTNNNPSPAGVNFQQMQQTKKSSPWSVGLTYLPMFTNRKVSYDLQDSNPVFIDDTTSKKKDEYLFKNNFGLDIYYNISKKLYLHSGLYAITFGEKIFYDNIVYQNTSISPITTAGFADYIAPGSEKEHTNKYLFVQVPVSAGLNMRTGVKTSLNIETGFAYGYLIKINALEYMSISDSLQLYALDDALLTKMNRNQFFASASFSFDWVVFKNISWRNGMIAQYQLTDLYYNSETQSQHNYGFGFHTSLIFHFK